MNRRGAKALLTLTAAALFSACSSSSNVTAGDGKNPVDVLRQITGCTLAPGSSVGDSSGGVRYAHCSILDTTPGSTAGDQITAYTGAAAALKSELLTQGGNSTDSTKLIVGTGFFLTDTGSLDPNTGGIVFITPPETVASVVAGTVK